MAYADDLLKKQGIHPDSSGFYENLKAYVEPRAAVIDAMKPAEQRRDLIASLQDLVNRYTEERAGLIKGVQSGSRKMDDLMRATDRFARADAALKRLQAEEKNEAQMAAVAAKKAKEGASREPIATKPKAPRDEALELVLNPRPPPERVAYVPPEKEPTKKEKPMPAELTFRAIPRVKALENEIAERFGGALKDNGISARTFLQLADLIARRQQLGEIDKAGLTPELVTGLNRYAKLIAGNVPRVPGTVEMRIDLALRTMNSKAEERYEAMHGVKKVPGKSVAAGTSG